MTSALLETFLRIMLKKKNKTQVFQFLKPFHRLIISFLAFSLLLFLETYSEISLLVSWITSLIFLIPIFLNYFVGNFMTLSSKILLNSRISAIIFLFSRCSILSFMSLPFFHCVLFCFYGCNFFY